jgi:hypothetical protein
MPQVTLKTGILGSDGKEEILHEYFCDWPGCLSVAKHVLGVVREIRLLSVVCDEHAALMAARNRRGSEESSGTDPSR